MARRIPPDFFALIDTYRKLGSAARRALWLSERAAEKEVQEAARRASALAETAIRRAGKPK